MSTITPTPAPAPEKAAAAARPALHPRRILPMWAGLLVLAALTALTTQANVVLSRYQLDIATTLLAFIALAQAWNILAGYSGQFSLGASAFVGSGAYASGLVQIHLGVGYVVALAVAAVAGGALAAVLAWPLLRLRGDYFTIGTLAAALAIQAWAFNWPFAGGSTGLSLPIDLVPEPVVVFRLACVVAGVVMGAAYFVARSHFGLRLRAVRDHESAATGLGVSAFRHRLAALMISGVLTGLVGGLVAMQQVSFEPSGMLGISWTINALLMTIVGGLGTLMGPVVGAVVVYYLLTTLLAGYESLSIVIEGVLLVVIVRFAPRGLWPLLLRGVQRLASARHRLGPGEAPDHEGPLVDHPTPTR